ncbi:hypothetical protein PQ689_09520 [Thermoanaerobacterium thermosaccharolyticum]
MEAVGEIKKIKGDNISKEQINKIIGAIKRQNRWIMKSGIKSIVKKK